jgi:hypothetical protein
MLAYSNVDLETDVFATQKDNQKLRLLNVL